MTRLYYTAPRLNRSVYITHQDRPSSNDLRKISHTGYDNDERNLLHIQKFTRDHQVLLICYHATYLVLIQEFNITGIKKAIASKIML